MRTRRNDYQNKNDSNSESNSNQCTSMVKNGKTKTLKIDREKVV